MRVYNDPVNIDATLWHTILTDETVTRNEILKVFQAVFDSEDCTACATDVASTNGDHDYRTPTGYVVAFSKRLHRAYPAIMIPPNDKGRDRWWHVPFLGRDEGGRCYWIMRPELIQAMVVYLKGQNTSPSRPGTVLIEDAQLYEGTPRAYRCQRFERSGLARRLCIQHHGPRCAICGFEFSEAYGPDYDGLIIAHHTKPLASIRKSHKVDYIKDLVPVCPNCHYVIHHGESVLDIDELKSKVQEAREAKLERRRTSTSSV